MHIRFARHLLFSLNYEKPVFDCEHSIGKHLDSSNKDSFTKDFWRPQIKGQLLEITPRSKMK
jgi:hypothetical protein